MLRAQCNILEYFNKNHIDKSNPVKKNNMGLCYRERGSLKLVRSYLRIPRWGCSAGFLLQDSMTPQADLNSIDLPKLQSEDQERGKICKYIKSSYLLISNIILFVHLQLLLRNIHNSIWMLYKQSLSYQPSLFFPFS